MKIFINLVVVALASKEDIDRSSSLTLWEASGFDVSAYLVQLESAIARWPEGRLASIQTSMYPTFMTLPKNEHGNLGAPGVRYLVSRFFKHEYSWHLNVLDAAGDAWNSSSPMEVLRAHLPSSTMINWETRLDRRGFGLPETAALAASLQSLIEAEAMEKIEVAYLMHNFRVDVALPAEDVDDVLETYMAGYILNNTMLNRDQDTASLQQNRAYLTSQIAEYYPFWNQTKVFVRAIRREMTSEGKPIESTDVRRIVVRLQEQWWSKLNHECRDNKAVLLTFEDQGTGCVRVADFYGKMVDQGYWQFGESLQYLRDLGVLDETKPEIPHIIVPNYINAQSNCVQNSRFYSTCCKDECEELQLYLERFFGKAMVTAAEIAAVVSTLPSSTTTPRVMPKEMLRHLDEIAKADGGSVDLHGHLFAQWMHHAYPRECPYPHLAGTTHQIGVDDYQATGVEPVFSPAEAAGAVNIFNQTSQQAAPGLSTCTPWSLEEEEHIESPAMTEIADADEKSVRRAMRIVAPSAAIVTLGIMLMKSFTSVRTTRRRALADKHFKLPV